MNEAVIQNRQLETLRRAYLKLEEMQAKLRVAEHSAMEPIAIIGMGCRFPGGADTPESFWDLLRNGKEAVTEVPKERWDVNLYYDADPDAPGKMATRWGAFLSDIDQFDPQFFGITPREAASMDPQQRLLLEVCWEALENAGRAPDRLLGSSVGVFVGMIGEEYARLQTADGGIAHIDAYYGSGSASSIASGRIAYILGLQGPAISIDTSCSSSMVAVHLACQSLRNKECSMALAGGVNLMLLPDATIALTKTRLMAPDGHCKTFDASADGYVRGEGCGMVALKCLSDAVAGRDRVLAVIRGTAINQDGPSSGLTAPHGPAQQAVIRSALKNAGANPADIGYVEAHGTGTALGDPIEIQALSAVLGKNRSPERPIYVGAVKTNIGHLEGAAGIASLIKTVLVLQHKEIPPHLNLKKPNPYIPWDRLPVKVPRERIPWPKDAPLMAGVSSFGFSGTNVHMVLSAWEDQRGEGQDERLWHLLCLSAKNEPALNELSSRFRDYLAVHLETDVGDLCFTANAGRAQLPERLTVIARSTKNLSEKLGAFTTQQQSDGLDHGAIEDEAAPKIAFLFTGQGSQYVGMGRRLYETQPTFRRALDRCEEQLKGDLSPSLLSVLYPESAGFDAEGILLDQTMFTQTALFSLEYALIELWKSWGIKPAAVMGHSVGEYVAACAAGVMSIEDGLKLISARARLMQALPPGGLMAAVFTSEAHVDEVLMKSGTAVSMAVVNGPNSVVISGAGRDVGEILDRLAADGVSATRLNVSHAFHSSLMEPILDEFGKVASTLSYAVPGIHFISNVTGRALSAQEPIDASYWCTHVRQPVRFFESMKELYRLGYRRFLEIGPHPVLSGMAANFLPDGTIRWLPSLRRGGDDWREMLSSLAVLYRAGVRADWEGFDRDYHRRRLALPTYPFQRKRYWANMPSPREKSSTRPESLHPLLGFKIRSALQAEQYENGIRAGDFGFVNDHRVHGMTIMPAAAYIEMAIAAARQSWHSGPLVFEEAFIHEPLIFEAEREAVLQTILTPSDYGLKEVQIFSLDAVPRSDPGASGAGAGGWRLHFSGSVRCGETKRQSDTMSELPVDVIKSRCPEEIDAQTHYQQLNNRGYDLGPSLRTLAVVRRGNLEALGHVRYPDNNDEELALFNFPPALLDGCLQFFWTLLPASDSSDSYLPISFEEFTIFSVPKGPVWSHITLRSETSQRQNMLIGDVHVYDESGHPVASMKGLAFRKATQQTLLKSKPVYIEDWFYETSWEPSRVDVSNKVLTVQSPGAAGFLLRPDRIAEFIATRMHSVAEKEGLKIHHELVSGIEALSFAYIVQALQALGWRARTGDHVALDGLCHELGVATKYQRLLKRILDILVEGGILRPDAKGWEVLKAPDTVNPDDILARLRQYPGAGSSAQLELTVRCGQSLAGALTGKADPLSLLFPGGSLSLAAQLYSESPEARVFNSLARDAVRKAMENLPDGRKIRILELGAGTGGATSFVLPGLPEDRTEYVFTDISPVFLRKAAERFKGFGFVNYQLCNVERGPEEQDFKAQSFDIVIAMNMLHATPDLRRSLENVRRFLSPSGLLILLEGTAPERWIDITFGLTDGWWAFKDTDLRASYPLLSRIEWINVLRAVGFEDTVTLPESFDLSKQAVIIARNPLLETRQVAKSDDDGRWIVFADRDGIGKALAGRIAELGKNCVTISTAKMYERTSPREWSIAADRPDDFLRLFDELRQENLTNVKGIVHLWSLETDPPSTETTLSLEPAELRGSGSLLYLLQAVIALTDWSRPPQLFVVTKGAQAAERKDTVAFYQAPVLGLAKVVTLEHPDLNCCCIDLDPAADSAGQIDGLLHEISFPDEENVVAYRRGRRLVPRLRRFKEKVDDTDRSTDIPKDAPSVRLKRSLEGVLEDLSLVPFDRRAPGRGEVEIEVQAAGLGFRDLMNALAMIEDDEPLGFECSGRVKAVGEGVDHLTVGDEVVGLASGSFATHVIADARLVVPKPLSLSFEEAATLPAAFTTAHYALNHIGKVTTGEKVLIHAAAGGVGMAAVQLALKAGAEVFGTAGNDQKRSFLTSLGVQHVMDSRNLDFAAQIMETTKGRGVDIVLNSLTGDFILRSLSTVAPGGRFLEIGVRDILKPEDVSRIRPDVHYHVIELADTNREITQDLLKEVMFFAGQGTIRPLPLTSFALSHAADAFRFMAQAKHIGRIVVANDVVQPLYLKGKLRSDGTYVVTGGLSGLGLLVARWLVEKGARNLALVGRSPAGEDAKLTIREMESMGAHVLTIQADVSLRPSVKCAFEEIEKIMPPIRGIVHSAGILADAVLMKQDWDRFKRVMAPKVDGAWNLHLLTRNILLDFFILFSSTAGLFGSPGQGNHAAANAFLDALAHYRRQQGLAALSINWGVWSEIGSAAKRKADEWVGLQGISAITPQRGLQAFEKALHGNAAQVAILPVDWSTFLGTYAGGRAPAWLSAMRKVSGGKAREYATAKIPAKADTRDVLGSLTRLPVAKRQTALMNVILDYTARVLGLPNPTEIDTAKPLSEQGVDSLMAVELRNLLAKGLGLRKPIPTTVIFDYPTIDRLTDFLLLEASLVEDKDDDPTQSSKRDEDMIDAIQRLSDEEVDRLLGTSKES